MGKIHGLSDIKTKTKCGKIFDVFWKLCGCFSETRCKDVLGFSTEGDIGLYLGLPEQICDSKMSWVFTFVQDRLNGRVNTWSSNFYPKEEKKCKLNMWLKQFWHLWCRVTCFYKALPVNKRAQLLIFGGALNGTTEVYIGEHETRSVLPRIRGD